jgi:hypothetical protein
MPAKSASDAPVNPVNTAATSRKLTVCARLAAVADSHRATRVGPIRLPEGATAVWSA